MTNPIERSIELHHSGVVHSFLKKNQDYLQRNPEMRAKVVGAFFQSHGGQSSYNGRVELTQTDLYRLLDLVKKGILLFSDFVDLVPKVEYRVMLIMNSRAPGWASNTEIAAAVARPSFEFEIKNLLERTQFKSSSLTDFEKDAKRAFEKNPGLREMIEKQMLVGEVIDS